MLLVLCCVVLCCVVLCCVALLSFVVRILGRFLVVLGVSWVDVWSFGAVLGGLLGGLGGSWAALGASWVGMERFT